MLEEGGIRPRSRSTMGSDDEEEEVEEGEEEDEDDDDDEKEGRDYGNLRYLFMLSRTLYLRTS